MERESIEKLLFGLSSLLCSITVYQYLHVFLCVDTAVGCQFVGLRELGNSLLQAVHLRVHSIYGLNRSYIFTSPALIGFRF